MRINPDKPLIVDSECTEDCTQNTYVYKLMPFIGNDTYRYWGTGISYSIGKDPQSKKMILALLLKRLKFILGNTPSALSLPANSLSSASIWKLKLRATNSYGTIGSASLLFLVNSLPTGGTCSVDLNNGTAMDTYFTISCTNWIDRDGSVVNYEYYGKLRFFRV